ncbi:MAG: branched-chain amino acid ABC transporter permease, partial [Solirubrobacterales bacterium]
MNLRRGAQALGVVAFVAVIALLPRLLGDFRALEFARVGILFTALVGLNVLTGYTGQISLGHGAFMAVGGYVSALLILGRPGLELAQLDPPSWIPLGDGMKDIWTIPIAALVAGVVGLVVGVPALRLTGLYVALATFALAVSMPIILREPEMLTGGTNGLNLFGTTEDRLTGAIDNTVHIPVLNRDITFNDWTYYLCWTVALIGLATAWLLLRGRTGRALKAIRDSEVAATSSGINVASYKTLAFGVSAAYAGAAGALFAIVSTIVTPGSFPVLLSIELLIGVVIAGLGSLWGIMAGALFLVYLRVGIQELADVGSLPDGLQDAAKSPGMPAVIYGAVLVLVLFLLPRGAAGFLRNLWSPLTKR